MKDQTMIPDWNQTGPPAPQMPGLEPDPSTKVPAQPGAGRPPKLEPQPPPLVRGSPQPPPPQPGAVVPYQAPPPPPGWTSPAELQRMREEDQKNIDQLVGKEKRIAQLQRDQADQRHKQIMLQQKVEHEQEKAEMLKEHTKLLAENEKKTKDIAQKEADIALNQKEQQLIDLKTKHENSLR